MGCPLDLQWRENNKVENRCMQLEKAINHREDTPHSFVTTSTEAALCVCVCVCDRFVVVE